MTDQTDVCTLTQKDEFVTSDGKGRLICVTTLLSFEGHGKINRFYSSIAEACREYCGGELLSRYSKEREGAIWELRYKLALSAQMLERCVSVTLSVSLSDAQSHKTLVKHNETHYWSLEYDRLMPPKRAKTAATRQKT